MTDYIQVSIKPPNTNFVIYGGYESRAESTQSKYS